MNTVCPYFTMFPIEFPARLLQNQASKNDWVFDPFCGRGTTNFAARVKGLSSVGVDSSPVATAVAESKIAVSNPEKVIKCAVHILASDQTPLNVPSEPFWGYAYDQTTLAEICKLRESLLKNCVSPERKILRAIILGALHGPTSKTNSYFSYFSNQCTRTFAPKPDYSVKYWKERNLIAPKVNVLDIIRRRTQRYLLHPLPAVQGEIVLGDSRRWISEKYSNKFSWVITSPPYYGMRTYIQDQWIRNWFVGGPSKVDYQVGDQHFQHSSPEEFSLQLQNVWSNASKMSAPGARLICRFGGIHARNRDCVEILRASFMDSGWKITQLRRAGWALDGRRQATQFGKTQAESPREEYDLYAKRID